MQVTKILFCFCFLLISGTVYSMHLSHEWPPYQTEPTAIDPLDYGTAFNAALSGKATTLISYFDNGGNANIAFIPNDNRTTCLTMLNATVQRGHALCTKTLLNNGASPEVPDEYGCTPAHWAVLLNRPMCLYWLMQAKADLTRPVGPWQLTPLHLAALMGKTQIVQMLISAEVPCNITTAEIKNPTVIQLLAGQGASSKAIKSGKFTPYDLALSDDTKAVFEKHSQTIVDVLDNVNLPADLALIVCDYVNGNGSDNHQPTKPSVFDTTTTSTADTLITTKIASTILWTGIADGKEPEWYTTLSCGKKPATRMEGVIKAIKPADWEQKSPRASQDRTGGGLKNATQSTGVTLPPKEAQEQKPA